MGQSHSAINDAGVDSLDGGAPLHSGSKARAKRSKGLFQEQRRSLAGPVRNVARRRYEPPSPPSPPLASNQHTPEQSRELLEEILSTSLMPPQQSDTREYSRGNDAMVEGHYVDGDGQDLPAVLISAPGQDQSHPTTFISDNRVSVIPAQETILEEPESEAADSVRPGLLALSVLLTASPPHARTGSAIPEHPGDTSYTTSDGQQHLTVDATLAGDESISRQSTGSFQVRNSNEESDRQALLAYWQQAGDTILQRRHSWASTPVEAADGRRRKEQSYPSPYRSVPGRWTSSLDGRKGLLLDFSDGSKEAVEEGKKPDVASEMNASELSSTGAKMRRKPVPSWDSAEEKEGDQKEGEAGVATSAAHLAAPKQYLLWPAKVDEEQPPVTESRDKHNSHVSRASATTDALHSHVEALREGPRFVFDPSASGLMISTESSASVLGLGMGMGKAEPGLDSPAVGESPYTRPRKISLMARLKERVRRSSEATATSSLTASSPCKPPRVPSLPHTVMTPAMRLAADHKLRSGADGGMPTMYPSGVRRNRKSALDASEAVIAARAARRRSQRSVHSVSSRSTRPSTRSVRARPSFGSTSRHTIRQQHIPSEGAKGKTRSHSQPVPRQQHWWRHPLWPKKNRGTNTASVRGEEWRDEDQGEGGADLPNKTARLGNGSQPSLTGTELLAREQEEAIPVAATAASTSRDSPPLAYINSDNLLTPDPNDYHAFGYCSSSSDFSSLVRARFPVPVPPPRPSRRGSKRSVSNGRDSSSSPSPRLPEGEKRNGKGESASPATSKLISPSNKKKAMLPSLPAIGAISPRSSKQISDAGTAEVLLTDDASGGEAKKVTTPLQDRLEGDEADHIAIMHPIRMLREQEIAASQARNGEEGLAERGKREHQAGQEGDVDGESRARRDSSQRGASMSIAADASGEGASGGPAKRPMPAPPILAEPMTDLHSVARTNSASSVHTASTFGGRRRLVSMVRYSGEEVGSGSLARKSLPSTPNLSVRMLPGRSPVQVQRALPSLLSSYETALTGDLPSKPHSPTTFTTLGRRSGSHLVRESWTSADGPWDARLVAVSPDVKKLSPARGFAKPVRQDAAQTRQGTASTSDVLLDAEPAGEVEGDATLESETRDADRVPFAETAVQASLAALQALEQSEQGDDVRSRSAREKLMGSSNLSSTLAPSIMRMEPSMSEMSSYSRFRRRAVPYPVTEKDDFLSSSAEERGRRKPSSSSRAKRLSRRGLSSSASQTEGQSVALVFTSDSERARNGHGQAQTGSQRVRGGKKKSTRIVPPLPKKEDWDEKVVPALARRLRVEAEQEAEMVSSLPRRTITAPSMQRQESGAVDPVISHDVLPIQSQTKSASKKRSPEEVRARQASRHEVATSEDEADQRVKLGRSKQPKRSEDRIKAERKPQPASISSQSKRTPKIRKGYGCDDIKAWQASLGVASAPIATLVE